MLEMRLENAELQRYVDEQVACGNFPDAEAVIEDALLSRMMDVGPELTEEDEAAIQESEAQMARGETLPFEEFAEKMRAKYGIKK